MDPVDLLTQAISSLVIMLFLIYMLSLGKMKM